MSLYNSLFGFNEMVGHVMAALCVSPSDLPRFRDAWFDAEAFELVIHTRTGGANRADFAEGNAVLRALPGFLRDADDPFDNTYASWFYAVPPDWRGMFDMAKNHGLGRDPKPHERWQRLIADMKSGADTPDARRALEHGERVIKPQIEAALKDGPGAVRIIET